MPEIFHFDFMLRAFAAGAILAVIAPVIGIFMVVRRYSLMADTLAHISLTGVAAGMLAGTYPLGGALVVSVAAAVGIEKLRGTRAVFGESAVALFFWGGMAAAVVLLGLAGGLNAGLFAYLFGSISTVTANDLRLIALLGALMLTVIFLLYKELFFVSFDESLAVANGLRAERFNLVIVVLAAVAIVLAMPIVGALLIGALMVVPVVTAMQFGVSFRRTLFISIAISLASVMAGLVLSYYLDIASGGTIVITALGIFMVVWFITAKKR
ncbi:MAG: metal ABC transporter permease [Candidatus Magnetominusculus sp. LBB02]|nr:metal ABC transporter permease [Candidatus Magnetominusculus sp. LBB02]